MFIAVQISWLILLGIAELGAARWGRAVPRGARTARNLTFTVINHVAIPPLTVLCLAAAQVVHPPVGINRLPMWTGMILAVLAFDLAGYWFHRVSHRSLLLWRFHQVHHLDEDFDFTTGARVHTVEESLHQILLVAVAIVIGAPPLYLTVFGTLAFVAALWHHSNLAVPQRIERWLRLVVFTPETHVAHHHDQIEDTDTNFGFLFPWWDRMFGTFNRRQRTSDWRIGLDYSRDLGLIGLLLVPFHPRQLKELALRPATDAGPRSAQTAKSVTR
ncbi:sterol desaturase family protein [Gordonia sp. L191]|uniref:sterol desaturase family protein n=1 Tax=Gordonia sp. L191 TaxID=2982699 RepID=UPI0024C01B1D|nr:sterol desaturase family protein [Gordonia sp. L191]WHU47079.1 sterol desaturase family protein [Gordonia sp. L191]